MADPKSGWSVATPDDMAGLSSDNAITISNVPASQAPTVTAPASPAPEPILLVPPTSLSSPLAAPTVSAMPPAAPAEMTDDERYEALKKALPGATSAFLRLLSKSNVMTRLLASQKPADVPVLPKLAGEPDTWWGGFRRGLYNEFVRPMSSISGLAGMIGGEETATGGAGEEAVKAAAQEIAPRLQHLASDVTGAVGNLTVPAPKLTTGVPGTYSRLVDTVLPMIPKKGFTPAKIRDVIQKNAAPGEADYAALGRWLDAQPPNKPITQTEFADALSQHHITLKELWHGQPPKAENANMEEHGGVVVQPTSKWGTEYSLQGAENPRELLLQWDPHQLLNNEGAADVPSEIALKEVPKGTPQFESYANSPDASGWPSTDTSHARRLWETNSPGQDIIYEVPYQQPYERGVSPHYIVKGPYAEDYQWSRGGNHVSESKLFNTIDEAKRHLLDMLSKAKSNGVLIQHEPIRVEQVDHGGAEPEAGAPLYRLHVGDRPPVIVKRDGSDYRPYTVDPSQTFPYRYSSRVGVGNVTPEGALRRAREVIRGALSSDMERQKNMLRYDSPHFDEKNLLAHVRLSDHVTPDGKKVLTIEEMQTDWHAHEQNGGRYHGYVNTKGEWIPPRLKETTQENGDISVEPVDHNANIRNHAISGVGKTREEAISHLREQMQPPPDAPFKGDATTDLMMKRMIRYAADHGYDELTWTTGDQQAERYNRLIRDVVGIELRPETGRVTAFMRNGRERQVRGEYHSPQDLSAVLGHNIANAMEHKEGGYEFSATDADGERHVYRFNTEREAEEAREKLEEEHAGAGYQDWNDVSSRDERIARHKWYEDHDEDFIDAGDEAADEWARDEVQERLNEAAEKAEPDAIDAAVDAFENEHGDEVKLDRSSIDTAGRGTSLHIARARMENGYNLPPHLLRDLSRAFEDALSEALDGKTEAIEEEVRESDTYFTIRDEARDEAMRDAWDALSDREKLEYAREALPDDFAYQEGDGWDIGYINGAPERWVIDLKDHPIKIGSRGMEQQYDKKMVSVANKLGKPYGVEATKRLIRTGDPHGMWVDEHEGQWFVYKQLDGEPVRILGPFDRSAEASTALQAALKDPKFADTEEVWMLPITPGLKKQAQGKGFPLMSVLPPLVGMIVTLKNGQRVKVTKSNDDGTFNALPVRAGK